MVLVSLLTLGTNAAGEKKPEKKPTKKASSVKPTKTPKSIVEEFTGLPPADVDFIKELDKQFNEHGNKIRIKVERENSTNLKNTKRTIDGEVGYGHYNNQPEGGYHFSKPKYMLYPSAQHSLPMKTTHVTDETVTELEITPSHGYELRPAEDVYQINPNGRYNVATHEQQYYHQQQQQHHHQQQQQLYAHQQQQQHEESPTIVLRIPGPAKYAQHLQALLQQYLEIRAAQLYREIQEQEYQQQQHAIQLQQQQLVHQQQQHHQQQRYRHHHRNHHHQQQPQQAQATRYSQPDPYHHTYIPVHENYYESPKSRPTQPAYRKPGPTHVAYHSSPEPEHSAYQYETYHQHQHPQQHQTQVQYQYVNQQEPTAHEEEPQPYVYEKPSINFVTPIPGQEHHQEQYQQPPKYPNFAEYHAQHRPPHQEAEEYLPEPKLVENYPSDKHTRVIYTSQEVKAHLQQQASQEPSGDYEGPHQIQEQPDDHDQPQYIYQAVFPSQLPYIENKAFVENVTPQPGNDLHGHSSSVAPDAEPHYNNEQIIAITQKPKHIFIHAANSPRPNGGGHRTHSTRSAANKGAASNQGSGKGSTKRDAPYTEEQFRKVNKMVHRMKKKSQGATTTPESQTSAKSNQ
ncbi:alpha-protein kinase 1-like isoform X2 [Toxorhynchites rutilus septentrionalis]|nr:alpha-protein kinase 1-like isoform X2 [Toxorhynchites rutilus septentrionalis]